MKAHLRVVKVGGSLFDLVDLSIRLQSWTNLQRPAISVFLAGGGALAEKVRDWDQQYSLGEERSHWMCVDLLGVTAQLLCTLLPGSQWCAELETIRAAQTAGRDCCLVFAPAFFLRSQEAALPGTKLGRSWDVTSDSIAARLAEVLQADELVLLKSKLPSATELQREFDGDYVDLSFATAIRSSPSVRFVNLRDDAFAEMFVAR